MAYEPWFFLTFRKHTQFKIFMDWKPACSQQAMLIILSIKSPEPETSLLLGNFPILIKFL